MIEWVDFKNYRNLNGKTYNFEDNFNILIGKNGDGKTNVLEGIRLAFSSFDGSYMRVDKSDFANSDDSSPIEITVRLKHNSIPSFNLPQAGGSDICGFKVIIRKTGSGRYLKRYCNLDGTDIHSQIVEEDLKIPKVYMMPLIRVDDIYSPGLTTGIGNFLESEEEYEEFKMKTKQGIQGQIAKKAAAFKKLCEKFNKTLDVDVSDPKMSDEKLYIVDGDSEHSIRIGSGYKSIANVMLCSMGDDYNIILIDEIENHLHPALLRNLVNEIKELEETFVIATTHSPVVVNEFKVEKIIDTQYGNLSKIVKSKDIRKKINTFLHPGRAELLLANNIVLVEGFTEEVIIRDYISKNQLNWTVVNVAGVMFEPYVQLAVGMNKRLVVVSDSDVSESKSGDKPTTRFNNLKKLCEKNGTRIVEVDNTLETDLFNNGYLSEDSFTDLIKQHSKHDSIKVAKPNKKTEIAQKIIELNIDLSGWHVIKEVADEFTSS